MTELIATAIAFFTLQGTILAGVWRLRGQLAAESLSIRESINKIELIQVTDHERNEGRFKLIEAEFEGLLERTDHRFSLLDKRLKYLEGTVR
jgi:hypothetical protein